MSEVQTSRPPDSSAASTNISLDLLFGVTAADDSVDNRTPAASPAASPAPQPAVTAVTILEPPAKKAAPTFFDEKSAAAASAVQRDHKGRVIAARFCGQLCQFRYDTSGGLYGFTYARLAWSTADGAHWVSRDHHREYVLDARVTVADDGSLIVSTGDVTRTLQVNGAISDKNLAGNLTQTVRPSSELTAADLLCSVHVRNDGAITLPQPLPVTPALRGDKCDAISALQVDSTVLANRVNERRAPVPPPRIKKLRSMDAMTQVHPEPIEQTQSSVSEMVAGCFVKVLEKIKGENHISLARHLDLLACAAHQQRRLDHSRQLHERALAIKVSCIGADHADTGINFHGLAKIYEELGQYPQAEQNYGRAVRILEKGLAKARFLVESGAVTTDYTVEPVQRYINALYSLAGLYSMQGTKDRCAKLYEAAQLAYSSFPAAHSEHLDALLKNLSVMCLSTKLPLTAALP